MGNELCCRKVCLCNALWMHDIFAVISVLASVCLIKYQSDEQNWSHGLNNYCLFHVCICDPPSFSEGGSNAPISCLPNTEWKKRRRRIAHGCVRCLVNWCLYGRTVWALFSRIIDYTDFRLHITEKAMKIWLHKPLEQFSFHLFYWPKWE